MRDQAAHVLHRPQPVRALRRHAQRRRHRQRQPAPGQTGSNRTEPVRAEGGAIRSVVMTMQDLAPLDEIPSLRAQFVKS